LSLLFTRQDTSRGPTFESLAKDGGFVGVLDISTTELADELIGIHSAGPHRLEAAGEAGIPEVVSVGALDMCDFGPIFDRTERVRVTSPRSA
jgi:uncharacterized protein (UPF0261 family)